MSKYSGREREFNCLPGSLRYDREDQEYTIQGNSGMTYTMYCAIATGYKSKLIWTCRDRDGKNRTYHHSMLECLINLRKREQKLKEPDPLEELKKRITDLEADNAGLLAAGRDLAAERDRNAEMVRNLMTEVSALKEEKAQWERRVGALTLKLTGV